MVKRAGPVRPGKGCMRCILAVSKKQTAEYPITNVEGAHHYVISMIKKNRMPSFIILRFIIRYWIFDILFSVSYDLYPLIHNTYSGFPPSALWVLLTSDHRPLTSMFFPLLSALPSMPDALCSMLHAPSSRVFGPTSRVFWQLVG